MADIQVKLGEKIKKIRKEKELSQEQLATKSKLHRTYISDIERGDRNVSIRNIEKIAKALGVTISDLLSI
jgi:transcriptional regulator with XRE-family HTH domain